MSKDAKLIRGQIRQIVKEMLPEILTEQTFQHVLAEMRKRLDAIDERQKALQGFMVRQSGNPIAPKKD